MSDTKNTDDKTLGAAPKKATLSLTRRTVEQGTARQNFPHGRTKVVVVEKKKSRGPGDGAPAVTTTRVAEGLQPRREAPAAPAAAPAQPRQPERRPTSPGGMVLRSLSQDEIEARQQALVEALARDADEKRRAEEEARRRAEEEARQKAEAEARARREEAEAAQRAAEEARRAADPDAVPPPEPVVEAPAVEAPAVVTTTEVGRRPSAIELPVTARPKAVVPEEEEPRTRLATSTLKKPRVPEVAKPVKRAEDDRRNRGRLTITAALTDDEGGRSRSLAALKRRREKEKRAGMAGPREKVLREVVLPEAITIQELANRMAERAVDVIRLLMKQGQMLKINDVIDADTAELIATEMGHTVKRVSEADVEEGLYAEPDEDAATQSRPPVVTIMGHVDHGKTSLLDHIRRTRVASGEAGGITQHIGAYHVETPKGVISFLDTPGHAAFTQMRARGAKLTDIVVLVVAADDGVMPQTVEAIKHAKAAGVPVIVAINKMDKSDANPDNVKQGLANHDVIPEEWGGDTQFVPVSAKAGTGIDALLDAISIQAEVMELRAVIDGRATGAVIESSLDKGRGPVATVLVQTGTLKKGDFVVCGTQYGRVRALFDEAGRQVESATPSIPVVMLGLSGVPDAGDDFVVVEDERLAKDVAQQREAKKRETRLVKQAGNRMEDIMAQMGQGEGQQTLNLVVKADVQGSVEALRDSLTSLSNELIRINVIASGVGGINESDATLAAASKAVVIGFNVRADAAARRVIEANGLDLRYFSIIYDVIDQVKQVASGLLGVEIREQILGIAEVRDVFRSSKFGAVAGSLVIEGTVKKSKPIRVLRDSVVVFEGELESLRRFKDNVEEVKSGVECGIAVKAYNDVQPGDQIECFERIEVQRTL
jgi:translation initiation factor IF-2